MKEKPQVKNSSSQREIDKAEKQFDAFEKNIKEMTLDRMNQAPLKEEESQTKLSSKEMAKSQDVYLKPKRTISSREKFNEKYREKYNFKKEMVRFIAENREIVGETVDLWTKPFAGMPAEEWEVPVNKPVWGPRYLAERIKECAYHRLSMNQSPMSQDGMGTYYGTMVVDSKIQRLDATPATERKSIFMGASNF